MNIKSTYIFRIVLLVALLLAAYPVISNGR